MARILIAESELELALLVAEGLRQEGFHTEHVRDGLSTLREASAVPGPDLVLLNHVLPQLNGLEVCKELRRAVHTHSLPIVLISPQTSELDRVVGLELGADDYVCMPFNVRELVLRVRALLRRRTAPLVAKATPQVSADAIRMDVDAHEVCVQDRQVTLTALEFRLLHTLMTRRGRPQTRSRLLEEIWGIHSDASSRTLDTHVRRLRGKLGLAAASHVETVVGVGYRFRA